MRLMSAIWFISLMPVSAAFCADSSGDRVYPLDGNSACMERSADSARGGCLTKEDGSSRGVEVQTLPPEQPARQSPPAAEATPRSELPVSGGGTSTQ
jgi:hypothetical protein